MISPLEAVRIAHGRLSRLNIEYAFLGGCAVPLLVDRLETSDFRPTGDVDVVVKVICKPEFYTLEDRLRDNGFRHVVESDAPLFRWCVDDLLIDVMPTHGEGGRDGI